MDTATGATSHHGKAAKFLQTLTGWLHGGASYGSVDDDEDEEDEDSRGATSAACIKGFVPVYVGSGNEAEPQRFLVKLKHLEHPLFRKLLELREEELGFCDNCKLVIPCDVTVFQNVLSSCVPRSAPAVAAAADIDHEQKEQQNRHAANPTEP